MPGASSRPAEDGFTDFFTGFVDLGPGRTPQKRFHLQMLDFFAGFGDHGAGRLPLRALYSASRR
jgi:hypothetical protein